MIAPKQYLILLALMAIGLTGCKTLDGGVVLHAPGPTARHDLPPAHAPAHGRRLQQRHHYHYYPDAQVYFDLERKLYFFLSGTHWQASISLPEHFRLRLTDRHLVLEMEVDKPYQDFHIHKKKYPPGKRKHKDKNNKGHGQGKKYKERDDY